MIEDLGPVLELLNKGGFPLAVLYLIYRLDKKLDKLIDALMPRKQVKLNGSR